jgi:hypothetical protein
MTTLLDDAIAKVRELPAEEQDLAAELLLQVVQRNAAGSRLTAEQIEEVREIEEGLANGTERWATDEEVAALWRRVGV